MNALADLLSIVTLEPRGQDADGRDTFSGKASSADGVDATFGGHFLAQAVAAAHATVEDDRTVHAIHAQFLRGGEPGKPFELAVERVRDGRSFSTRRVRTTQGDKLQFELTASFAVPAGGPQMETAPPADFSSLPRPETLPTYRELMTGQDPIPLPEEWAMRDYGLDIRTIDAPWAPGGPSSEGGIRLWVKAAGPIPTDPAIQAAVLAYQSDESLADNIAIPWGATWGQPGVVFVSLDHAMWFHRPFDLNHWHLIDQKPVAVAHERGLATAQVFTEEGVLVASFTQEALLRLS